MKIGIFTFILESNYGGFLQAFALIEFLKSQGHEIYLIGSNHGRPNTFRTLLKSNFNFSKWFIKKYILLYVNEIFIDRRERLDYRIVAKEFIQFHFPNRFHFFIESIFMPKKNRY